MVSSHYHGTGKWHESVTVESWHGALGFVCALFRPEIGNRSRQGDLSEAKLALCLGYSRAGTSVFPFPSNAATGARADRNLWNAGNLDVCLGRSRIAIPPSDHGTQGHRLRAHLHGGCDLSRCGRHASFRKQLTGSTSHSQLSESSLVGRNADNQYWIRVPAGDIWRACSLSRHFHLCSCNIWLPYCGLWRILYRAGCGGSEIRDS